MNTTFNNYLCHTNTWYWGTSIDIVHKKGIGIICVKLDDDYPSTAFLCDLSVFELNRKARHWPRTYAKRFGQR